MAADASPDDAYRTFRSLVERADRKFARVRDLPPYLRGPHHLVYYKKVFKAYTQLWQFQQSRRRELVASGLRRWEIGEVASRIGQLYYGQYLRTGESRFLLGAYVFYEAILGRGYFESVGDGKRPDLGLRYKELRFHARFLIVALLMNRAEAVKLLSERLRTLLDESKAAYPETNFKEWKLILQEISRFLKADKAFKNSNPLRYNLLMDSNPSTLSYIAPFHSKRVLRLTDAVLTSYHRNEVKFTELTLDTFRMLQCLEYEPTGLNQNTPNRETVENGTLSDQSGASQSGFIDVNLASEMLDPNLPSNPRKAIIYHPTVSHLIAVIATICEELSSESILLIYISASGGADHSTGFHKQNHKLNSNACPKSYVWLGPRGSGGPNNLYPEDLLPFTRNPIFLIVDSENSEAFKVIYGAEKGEPAALLLSPPVHNSDSTSNGSQFTYFLTAPLQAFCQLVSLYSPVEPDKYSDAEGILGSAFAELEIILCTSDGLDRVWAQILPDPFLRRIILRFIFCRAVLFLFHYRERDDSHLPVCLPSLPESVSPGSVKTHILLLAGKLGVIDRFPSLR